MIDLIPFGIREGTKEITKITIINLGTNVSNLFGNYSWEFTMNGQKYDGRLEHIPRGDIFILLQAVIKDYLKKKK